VRFGGVDGPSCHGCGCGYSFLERVVGIEHERGHVGSILRPRDRARMRYERKAILYSRGWSGIMRPLPEVGGFQGGDWAPCCGVRLKVLSKVIQQIP
jgi:hypothetical protein